MRIGNIGIRCLRYVTLYCWHGVWRELERDWCERGWIGAREGVKRHACDMYLFSTSGWLKLEIESALIDNACENSQTDSSHLDIGVDRYESMSGRSGVRVVVLHDVCL